MLTHGPIRVERFTESVHQELYGGELGVFNSVTYFEGGMGAEPLRKARVEYECVEEFYCGNTGRKLRTEIGDGTVIHFEGAPRKLYTRIHDGRRQLRTGRCPRQVTRAGGRGTTPHTYHFLCTE